MWKSVFLLHLHTRFVATASAKADAVVDDDDGKLYSVHTFNRSRTICIEIEIFATHNLSVKQLK